jgi:hypothetical protein
LDQSCSWEDAREEALEERDVLGHQLWDQSAAQAAEEETLLPSSFTLFRA